MGAPYFACGSIRAHFPVLCLAVGGVRIRVERREAYVGREADTWRGAKGRIHRVAQVMR